MLGGIQDSPSVFGETETSPRRERFTRAHLVAKMDPLLGLV